MDGIEVNIRPATLDDLGAIAAIQAASPEASQWDPGGYLDNDCGVAIEQGRVTGFLASRRVAPDEREILNVAVDPAHRRKGVARALLADELARGPGRWFLEVRASNAAALRLYESAGFERYGSRPGYYREPAEEAIVMRFFS
jgi:[ribosomal protein S18]-alanine N-acetyltransferase